MGTIVDYYELLGVVSSATDKDLNKAYRIKALQYHPDKNRDNPQAVQLFHKIKEAYDVLIDSKQRAEYDEKQKAIIAKRQRQNAMSTQRKKMKTQLEKDELAARDARKKERMQDAEIREEAARFRDEALREEWRHNKRMREQIQKMHEEGDAHEIKTQEEASTAQSDVDELDRSIRIKWDSKKYTHDKRSIERIFSVFGELEEIVIAPVSENARRRGDGLPSSALLVFKMITGAYSSMNSQTTNGAISEFLCFWATGQEPQSVTSNSMLNTKAFLEKKSKSMVAGGSSTRANQVRIPDISAIDLKDIPGYTLGFEEFEAMTLVHMREPRR